MSNDEWYTPPEVLNAVEAYFGRSRGIGLDPTSSPDSPAYERAKFTLTAEDDCLESEWPWNYSGGSKEQCRSVFLNPPYSGPGPFLDKLVEYCEFRSLPGIALVNASTDTQWGQALLAAGKYVCFCSPRLRFLRRREPDDSLETVYTSPGGVELVQPGSPRYSNMIVSVGKKLGYDRFLSAFRSFGYCALL